MRGMKQPAEAEIIVGGQAVLEGVMMRSPNAYAVSVRRADGSIVSKSDRVPRLSESWPIFGRPVIRGAATLIHSMALGIKALNFSSAIALADEKEKEEAEVATAATAAGSIVFALLANVAIFILLPLALTNAIWLLAGPGIDSVSSLLHSVRPTVAFNLVEGAIRVSIFLALIYAMSRLDDMHRVFQYHGAEHKVVTTYESGLSLTVENARRQPRRHPRCGTSFLMVVMLVAIALFSVVRFDSLAANAGARIALLPLVAGLSFEVIRAAARKQSGRLFQVMVAPGLWLQGITTQEPTDDQLEVAIDALEKSLALESAERSVRSAYV